MIVRVTGFMAEFNTAKLGSNSGHMSTADELDCASEELREFGDWSGSKEIHVDDGDDPKEDRVNETVTDEFNIAYLTVNHFADHASANEFMFDENGHRRDDL